MIYEIGPIYIWQNQVGEMEFLNNTECTVIAPPTVNFDVISNLYKMNQQTDSHCPDVGFAYFAEPGDLRRKFDPMPWEVQKYEEAIA